MQRNQVVWEFFKRFVLRGFVTGAIIGALFPLLIVLVGPVLMSLVARPATQVGDATPVTYTTTLGSWLYVCLIYGGGGAIIGAIAGTLVGVIDGIVIGLITQRSHSPLSNVLRFRQMFNELTAMVTLIASLVVFTPIVWRLWHSMIFLIPAIAVSLVAAMIVSQPIAQWYVARLR